MYNYCRHRLPLCAPLQERECHSEEAEEAAGGGAGGGGAPEGGGGALGCGGEAAHYAVVRGAAAGRGQGTQLRCKDGMLTFSKGLCVYLLVLIDI